MNRLLAGLATVACMAGTVFGGSVAVLGEGFIPEIGQAITIEIVTDTPLMCMEVHVSIVGDANLAAMMTEADSTSYGWDPFWTGDGYIDGSNAVFHGVSWMADANDVVGYFTFVYNGGEVRVNVSGSAWGGSFEPVPFQARLIRFGNPISVLPPPEIPQGRFTAGEGEIFPATVRWDQQDFEKTTGDGMLRELTSGPLIYDVNTILTENTIWEGEVILNGTVFVEGCVLAIMPGTFVYNASGGGGIVVRNDGAIIADGTNMDRICFVPLAIYPSHNEYPFAVKIESTASTASVIAYAFVAGAERGIWIDNNRLLRPIEQMTINWCHSGIYQEGPALTDIINNEMINCWLAGIEVHTAHPDDPNNMCSSETYIAIRHNSIIGFFMGGYGQWFGMIIHGSPDPNETGIVQMSDNLIAGSFVAMNVGGGWLRDGQRYNHGYYSNDYIDVWDYLGHGAQDDVDAKITETFPFVSGNWPFLLNPNSVFVDGGSVRIEDAPYLWGQSTFQGVPDTGMVDIGFHYNREGFVNAGISELLADLTGDSKVDANDLAFMAACWLMDPNDAGYDATANLDTTRSIINFGDFAILAKEWGMDVNSVPLDLPPQFDQDIGNLSGEVVVSIELPERAVQSWLYMDGKIVGEFHQSLSYDSNSLTLDTRDYPNGPHEFKLGFMTDDGNIYLTTPIEASFNNLLYQMRKSDTFHPSNDYVFSGFYYGGDVIEAKLLDEINETVIWSQTFSGSSINLRVPGETFENVDMCSLAIAERTPGEPNGLFYVMSDDVDKAIELLLIKKYNISDSRVPRMLIVLPDEKVFKVRKPAVIACAKACNMQNIPWVALYHHDVDPINLSHVFQSQYIRYVYWVGHGGCYVAWPNRKLTPVQRTHAQIWDNPTGSYKKAYAFSHTEQTKPNRPVMPYPHDRTGFDLTGLGLEQSNKMKIVFFDGCLTSTYNDMADAFGMYSTQSYSTNDQIYIGWRTPVTASSNPISEKMLGNTTKGIQLFWEQMGNGRNVSQALAAIYHHPESSQQLWRFFGTNGQWDGGDPSSDDNIILRGTNGGRFRILD